jgi:translocator assembly and maintenance protein 41
MLSTTSSRRSIRITRTLARRAPLRSLSTDPSPPPSAAPPQHAHPPAPKANPPGAGRSRALFSPTPRAAGARPAPPLLPYLSPTFAPNQRLSVPDEKRALLERVVGAFHAPVRYAFAYGSGVFAQAGYDAPGASAPMLDFVLAVSHAGHWHSINMQQFPGHYPYGMRLLGSDVVSRVQEMGPGVWFNTYVQMEGVVSLPLRLPAVPFPSFLVLVLFVFHFFATLKDFRRQSNTAS